MSRAMLILANPDVRARAIAWCRNAPDGTRVTFLEAKRTNEQNAKLWASLTDIATQATLRGMKLTTDEWKAVFMAELGHEAKFLPRLEGTGFVPIGFSSSQLSKKEMADLITLILAWGDQNGVKFQQKDIAA